MDTYGKNGKRAAQTPEETVDTSRRSLLRHGSLAVGGAAVFAAGYSETLIKGTEGLISGTAGVPTASATRGNSLPAEFTIDPKTGLLTTHPGQIVAPSSCLGCWTQCGVRVRVDVDNNRILRVAGNPYHPLATTSPAPMQMPVREVFSRLGGDPGLEGRATACGRGAAMLEQYANPYRVLKPLKRVGPRGSGKWQTISFEQLIEEVCEGGDLFGEGHVDGLRAIHDNKTPIDADNPEYGPLSNQLLVTDSANEGRTPLIQRFAQQAFGTVNVSNHGSYCGQTFRVGAGAALGDIVEQPHGKPDWTRARFGLFIGAAPAQSGNPFQRQARELAQARTRDDGGMRYIVVSPVLPASSSLAAGTGNRWVPVKPGSDLALAMGLIRWILDNERYDKAALSQPGPQAMAVAGEVSWTNAAHLVVSDPGHPRHGTCLRGADMGWNAPVEGQPDAYVVRLPDGTLAPHTVARPAEEMVEAVISVPGLGGEVEVRSALAMLRAAAHAKSMDEYAELCGIPAAEIEAIAKEFTSYGKQAVADAHGGTMNGSGFYTAYAISMLNTLVGNLNVAGGLVLDNGTFGPYGKGARYVFGFPGQIKPGGVALSRHRFPYEKSSEFRRKQAAGLPVYPAKAPWYPAVGALSSEMLASGLAGYPYRIKAWINHMSNPVYSMAGFKNMALSRLRDPKNLPLIVSVNPFINETAAESDYIVPDTVTYESWGVNAPWGDVEVKAATVRSPVVQPRVDHTADGQPINLESFLIACALRLGLPGFGKDVIADADGGTHDLLTAEDFYLRGVANIAFAGGKAAPAASEDDMMLTGINRYEAVLREKLKPDEWRQAAGVLTRGGRFQPMDQLWDGEKLAVHYAKPLQFWSEDLSKLRHSMTGERLSGCPTWYPTRLANGDDMRDHYAQAQWPFMLTSYKSHLMSSMSIAASRLRQVHPHNPVSVNEEDARRLGIRSGDAIRIVTPGGAVTGVAMVRQGVAQGAIAVEHGYGHTELGARSHVVDGHAMPADSHLAAGVNLNDLGFADVTRSVASNVWIDWVSGGVVRQGYPARLEKIQA